MLKIAIRHILRFKKTAALNIAGLAIGIAAALIIFMIIRFETSFDTQQPNYKNIYRIVTQTDYSTGVQYNSGVSTGVPDALRTEFPQMEKVAALQAIQGSQFSASRNSQAKDDNIKQDLSQSIKQNPSPNIKEDPSPNTFREDAGTYFIEPSWFDLFHQKWLSGSPSQLAAPDVAALDKSTAEKYFGTWQHALGQILTLDNKYPLKIIGILDNAPANTDFPLRIVVSFETLRQHPDDYSYVKNDWSGMTGQHQVFVQLALNTPPEAISTRLKSFSKDHFANQIIKVRTLLLLPLKENHFDNRFSYIVPHVSSHTSLLTLSFIGMLILLMAIINFINLSTAQSAIRAKEIGIRKVLGSLRIQLIKDLLLETAILVSMAMVLGAGIAQLSLPAVSKQFAHLPVSIWSIENAVFLCTVVIVVTLFAGIYPAFILSGYQPLRAFKPQPGAFSVRRGLIITQFAISQIMIICVIVAMAQVHLLQSADLGFNKDAVYTVPGFGNYDLNAADALKTRLKQYAGFTSITLANMPPAANSNWMDVFYFDQGAIASSYNIDIRVGDADYVRTFGLQLIAGRNYRDGKNIRELLINQTFARELGYNDPANAIGHTLKIGNTGEWHQIVGVIKDFTNNTLREHIRPSVVMPWREACWLTCVRLNDFKMVEVLKDEWMKAFPGYVFNGSFLTQQMQSFYQQEQQLSLLYRLFAGIAIFISCLGLYGMVSFMAVQKQKEIGIRKVLGASVMHILYLFWKEFLVLVGIAFLIAAPAGWWLMNNWLQHFALRTEVGATVFLTAMIASVAIALLTVSHKAMTAALTNPVKSIQTE
ncbi:ABC transporter permease [Chitinophaga silvisoli]|uniref:ABC transporter permease n=1 Tax=Chitinophaga silvisoli TaxID=2291814 RepID=A0A3E1P7A1_9BACT|nr:ABC transporter permease [Chitinophaga silvisoli]RFM36069.1 ABC transporter permease [Chitinophaga silvisoli]